MSETTYKKRKSQGLCVKCGKTKAVQGKVMCFECAQKSKRQQREAREYFYNLGLCSRCGKNRLFGDEKECPECSAKMYEINQRSRERRNMTAMDYYRIDITRLKEQGLCVRCRKKKVATGRTYCQECLVIRREQAKKYNRKNDKAGLDRSERPNYGFCYTCGEPLDRDGRICKKCSEIMTKNLPKERSNKAWREDNKLVFANKC